MTDSANAYTHIHPASEKDRETVHDILQIIRNSGKQDSGAVVLNKIKEISNSTSCVTLPFEKNSIFAELVVTPGADSSAIIIYLHGRRFRYAEPAGVYAALISQATRLTVLKVNYRLAPEFPYPAALEDVLAAYEAVLALGVPPNRVFLVGHSAGATLCLSALLSLAGAGRPFPAATVAISPIIDFTFTADSLVRNQGEDAASLDELRQARQVYLGSIRPDQAPQSPLFGDLKGLPPVLLVCGGSELLLDDSIHFAAKAAKAGVDIALDIFEEHGFAVMRLSASDQVLSRVSTYIASRLRQGRSDKVGPLTLERVGWAGYVITTEYGTKILVDPYLSGNRVFPKASSRRRISLASMLLR